MGKLLKEGDVFTIGKGYIEYLCIETKSEGGGTGHGCNDIYPDGHSVYYVRLNDGKFDPKAKVRQKYQSGCFIDEVMLPIEKVNKKRKMKKSTKVTWK